MNEKQTTQLLESLASIAHSLENISYQLTPKGGLISNQRSAVDRIALELQNICPSDAQTDVLDLTGAAYTIGARLEDVGNTLDGISREIRDK